MDAKEKEVLRQQHVPIVKNLEPKDILPHLLQDGIITDNDYELISQGVTRRERCQALLSMLPRRKPTAYGSFKKALNETSYSYLAELLQLSETPQPQSAVNDTSNIDRDTCECSDIIAKIKKHSPIYLLLKNNCCLLLNNVEPKEIVDHFYAAGLLSGDDFERVTSGKTRKVRCEIFFPLLTVHAMDTLFPVLCTSLNGKYSFIAEKLLRQSEITCTNGQISNGSRSDSSSKSSKIVEQSDGSEIFPKVNIPEDMLKINFSHERKQKEGKRKVFKQNYFSDNSCKETTLHHNDHELVKDSDSISKDLNVSSNKNGLSNGVIQFSVNPGAISPFELPNRKLVLAFNRMSCLINQGIYEKFDSIASKLEVKYKSNADMSCLISYLRASRHLFGNKFDDAKNEINKGFDLVPKTTNPKYFTVELFTAQTRMYITQKKLNKLEDSLTDVKQIIETDPVGCTGRAAGWLYMNDARGKTAQMSIINLYKPNSIPLYNKLHKQARDSFQKALANFSKDGGKDGPFGCGYALCRLAILLLRCGDNGLTMENLSPCVGDVDSAGNYLRSLEESTIPMHKILEMHYRLAKCDYFYRRNNTTRALEHANVAYSLATELNLMEFTEHAHNRLLFLNTKTPLMMEEVVDEDEVMNELLGDSQDSN